MPTASVIYGVKTENAQRKRITRNNLSYYSALFRVGNLNAILRMYSYTYIFLWKPVLTSWRDCMGLRNDVSPA